MEDFQPGYLDTLDLEIDGQTTASIKEAAKWTKFISILMFCLCGLLVIFLAAVMLSENFMDNFTNGLQAYGNLMELDNLTFFSIIIIAVVLVFLTIYYFLFNFSRKVKTAVVTENTEELNKGLSSLKIYFIIYGSLGLLSTGLSALALFKLLL